MPWIHASLRGAKVFARVDANGSFAAENGRVEIRYKPNDGRKYGARADNLTAVSGEILPEETCGPAGAVADGKTGASAAGTTTGIAGAAGIASAGAAALGGAATPARPSAKAPARAKKPAAAAPATAEAAQGAVDPDRIHVYADGACSGNPGPAGLGVVVLDGESRVELSEYIGQGTNNIAELTAILRALGEVADSERPLLIHTDSSYSIGVLQKGWKAKANQTLVAQIRDVLARRKGTRLVYVPGHAGVQWNERADELARAAVVTRSSTRKIVRSATTAARA